MPKRARESSVAGTKPALPILPEHHRQHHYCVSNFLSPNTPGTCFLGVLWLKKTLPPPSNAYLCPSLPPSSPLGLGRRRGAAPGCGLPALPCAITAKGRHWSPVQLLTRNTHVTSIPNRGLLLSNHRGLHSHSQSGAFFLFLR